MIFTDTWYKDTWQKLWKLEESFKKKIDMNSDQKTRNEQHQEKWARSCCIRKSTMNHVQKLDCKLDLPYFSCDHWKFMFVDFLIAYIGPPNCVHCGV